MTNILGYGELMLRHTPVDSYITTNGSKEFKTNFGGSESNSLCFLASKGHNCTFLSAFPKNDLGLKSIKFLENNNVKPKIIFDDNDDVYIIHIVNNMYGCEKILKESLKNYEINRYEIINYDKPILSIGNYKLDELLNIANLIGVSNYNESDKKLTKQELNSLLVLMKALNSIEHRLSK